MRRAAVAKNDVIHGLVTRGEKVPLTFENIRALAVSCIIIISLIENGGEAAGPQGTVTWRDEVKFKSSFCVSLTGFYVKNRKPSAE